MVPRGEVVGVVAQIGQSLGLIGEHVYAVVLLMPVATTLVAPPLLNLAYRDLERPSVAEKRFRIGQPKPPICLQRGNLPGCPRMLLLRSEPAGRRCRPSLTLFSSFYHPPTVFRVATSETTLGLLGGELCFMGRSSVLSLRKPDVINTLVPATPAVAKSRPRRRGGVGWGSSAQSNSGMLEVAVRTLKANSRCIARLATMRRGLLMLRLALP